MINADNFLNSLGLWISAPAFSMPALGPLERSGEAGNSQAGASKFDEHSTTSLVRYLGVRWDGDKVRGIGWQYFDDRRCEFGDYNAVNYALTSYAFAPGESLTTLSVKDSGYGHGSVRRIEFTTSLGGCFSAGPDGFDHETSFSVFGSFLTGFHGGVNADNFLNSLGLWISAPTGPSMAPGTATESASAGNPQAGQRRFDRHSGTSPIRYVGVRWDGDKVRGIGWQYFDGGKEQCGDYDAVQYALTSYTFAPDESLATLTFKDSGYGHGSVRRIEFTTSRGGHFAAGPAGFDRETSVPVGGSYLLGFSGMINADNFLNSIAAWISPKEAPQLVVDGTRKGSAIGNAGAGKTTFDQYSPTSPLRYLSVRWDGDKVRGMAWEHFDGTQHKVGDYDAITYALTSYTFAADEFLTSLTLKDSGYGHGSVRRVEFRTSRGGVFAAGPDGFDNALSVPAYGAVLLGFHGTVNVDNFLNSLGAYVSAPLTMNGWDYTLALDQRLLNTLMPLLAQINPKIHTQWGDIQIQRVWIASAPAPSTPGILHIGLQVGGNLTIDKRTVPTGEDTIWRIIVGVQLAAVNLRLETVDRRLGIRIDVHDKTAFTDMAVEFTPARPEWSQLVAPLLLQALRALATQPLHVASLDAPKLPGAFSGVTGWLPTDIELAYVAGSRIGAPGGLAFLVSTTGAAPALDSRRSFYAATLRPGPELAFYCSNDRLIRLLGGTIEGVLRQQMGPQDQYAGNHPFEFSYPPASDGGRRRAYTAGNYCNFWSIKFKPSIDWCWIDAVNDQINVELRLRAVPMLDAVYYVTLDAAITFEVDASGTILRPHIKVDVHTESHIGPQAGVTLAAVAVAGNAIIGPIMAVAASLVAIVPDIVNNMVTKVVDDQVASADISQHGAI